MVHFAVKPVAVSQNVGFYFLRLRGIIPKFNYAKIRGEAFCDWLFYFLIEQVE